MKKYKIFYLYAIIIQFGDFQYFCTRSIAQLMNTRCEYVGCYINDPITYIETLPHYLLIHCSIPASCPRIAPRMADTFRDAPDVIVRRFDQLAFTDVFEREGFPGFELCRGLYERRMVEYAFSHLDFVDVRDEVGILNYDILDVDDADPVTELGDGAPDERSGIINAVVGHVVHRIEDNLDILGAAAVDELHHAGNAVDDRPLCCLGADRHAVFFGGGYQLFRVFDECVERLLGMVFRVVHPYVFQVKRAAGYTDCRAAEFARDSEDIDKLALVSFTFGRIGSESRSSGAVRSREEAVILQYPFRAVNIGVGRTGVPDIHAHDTESDVAVKLCVFRLDFSEGSPETVIIAEPHVLSFPLKPIQVL